MLKFRVEIRDKETGDVILQINGRDEFNPANVVEHISHGALCHNGSVTVHYLELKENDEWVEDLDQREEW